MPATWSPGVEFPWMTVFMEAAVRALRVVHHAHQPLTLGRPGQDNQGTRLDRLNVGPGIELADERVVCSQILIELATSRITSEVHFPEQRIGDQLSAARGRTFEFDREKYEAHIGYVDLVFRRSNDGARTFGHIYIEAKRARRWMFDAVTGEASKSTSPLTDEVAGDIRKLRKVAKSLKKGEEAYFYVLVWGSTDDDPSPDAMLRAIRGTYPDGRFACRWLPLSWDAGSWTGPPAAVRSWLWLALMEVLPRVEAG